MRRCERENEIYHTGLTPGSRGLCLEHDSSLKWVLIPVDEVLLNFSIFSRFKVAALGQSLAIQNDPSLV